MQRDTQRPSDKLKTARRCFSVLGCAVLLLLAGQLAVSRLVDRCMPLFFPAGGYPTWLPLLIAYLVFFGIVFPLAALLLRRLPVAAPEKGKISARHFFAFLPILYLCSYVGSQLSQWLIALLADAFGLQMGSALGTLLLTHPLVMVFIFLLAAPLCEEWFFRKLLLDRACIYGEKLAIFVSALLFACYHTSVYQFFYAFFVGLILGYLYLRTGKLWVTVLMHAVFNLLCSILPYVMLRFGIFAAFMEAETLDEQIAVIAENPVGVAVACVYVFVCLGLLIGGCLLLGKYRKKVFFKPAACPLPPDTEGAAAFVNVGMLLCIIASVLITLRFH